MNAVKRKLDRVLRTAEIIPYNEESKFIIMSDCHRGKGNTGDNFMPNRLLHFAALEYYYKNGFMYIEAGDGDELWANRKIQPIITAHSDIFRLMSDFYMENRLRMIYGNHDIIKSRRRMSQKAFRSFYCDSCECRLFPGIEIPEGIILQDDVTMRKILLVHGHQGSFLNDTIWPVARFLVRYFWQPLELVGFIAPTGAARNHSRQEAIERNLAGYARDKGIILIAGHTHRPVFPKPGEGLYFNDGSCVHPKSITGIEIENRKISLIKWSAAVRPDLSLCISRSVIAGAEDIENFYKIKKV